MTIRVLAVLSAVLVVACGAEQSPNDGGTDAGSMTSCSTKPFGVFTATQCDGGALGTFTFQSDGGASWQQAGPYECSTDFSDCEVLLSCSDYRFDLQSSQDARQLTGLMHYQGRAHCVAITR